MKKPIVIYAVIAIALAVAALVFAGGYWLGHSRPGQAGDATGRAAAAQADFWSCSMHPQIQLPGPGKCPICAMDLIPVHKKSGAALGPRQIELSPAAVHLAQVRVTPVERRFLTARVRMVGKVEYDETKLSYIAARVPGRLDRLYVDYTGVPVKKGDHLASMYSPELLTAQEELFQALKTTEDLRQSDIALVRERAQATIHSAREKLRLWGLTAEQVDDIERSGQISDHLTLYAPVSGVVVEKHALEGIYVQTGSRIYTIADLSQVWVKLDAYESDLAWIHYGQEVKFQTEAYPGEAFTGRISFIDPVLDPKTRTVKVRVNVPNEDGRLKPEMFVRAVVRSQIADHGRVVDKSLAGKWISPMHPEIIKNEPGQCDICGMDLVKAEELGFVPPEAVTNQAPLTIPASAPLITGKRAVVYVALTNQPGVFEGREIVLGQRAGDAYVVKEGLRAGELVVVNGAFKIDSAVQIQAKPSMMNPTVGQPPPGHQHGPDSPAPPGKASGSGPEPTYHRHEAPETFRSQLTTLYDAYLRIQAALADDRMPETRTAVTNALAALGRIDMSLVEDEAHTHWMKLAGTLKEALETMRAAPDLAEARKPFEPVSESMIDVVHSFRLSAGKDAHVVVCPMAFGMNRAARWLQDDTRVKNPYRGHEMPTCGEVVESVTEPKP